VEARKIIPVLGRQLQTMRRDVEARNAEWERNKNILRDGDRQRVEQARAREEAQFQAAIDADKKAGIKWIRLNPRSKDSIEDYLELASDELKKVQAYDVENLAAQAAELEKVDQLIANGDLDSAEAKFETALAMPTGEGAPKRSSKKSSSYTGHLRLKLKEKLDEREAAEEAAEEAKKSEALTKELTGPDTPEIPAGDEEAHGAETEEEMALDDNAFAALAGVPDETKSEPKSEEKKKSTSKKTETKRDDDEEEEEEERDAPRPSASGGGFPIGLIAPILTVGLILVIVVLKVLGIGGKDEE